VGTGGFVGALVGDGVTGVGAGSGPEESLQIRCALGSARHPVVAVLKSTSIVPSPLSHKKHPQGTKFSHSNTFNQFARSK